MGEKEGGDPEKKMTKDFLDRWKKIASKYETKEEERPEKQVPAKAPGGPEKTAEEELDAFLEGLGQKPTAPERETDSQEREVEDLLTEFGLEAEGGRKAAAKVGPPPAVTARQEDQAQQRVMDTLKKVGLVGPAAAPPAAPAKGPAPAPAREDEEEEEDALLLELEALLTEEAPGAPGKGDKAGAPPMRGAFEEEDLLAELEVMLESEEAAEPRPVEGESAPRAKPPAPAAAPAVAPAEPPPLPAPVAPPEREAGPERAPARAVPPPVAPVGPPEPPRAMPARAARPGAERAGRVNGGRVNGGRVNGGRVNGGRVNGGRVNGGRAYLPATAAQTRRARITQVAIAGAVTVMLFASLVLLVPSGGGPQGPQIDGSLDDWAGSGALFYTGAADAALLPQLDLRQYALRADGETRLWFTAQSGADLFSRQGGATPARGDVLLVLIDVDGSASSGYSYRDLGVDRVVEVVGWSGEIRSSASRAFGARPSYDWGGFEPAGAVQVASSGDRIEGLVSGLTGVGGQTRAAFELRGVSPSGEETIDAPLGAATVGRAGIAATSRPVAGGLLARSTSTPQAMLAVSVENPSAQAVTVSELRVLATYAPSVPPELIGGAVWQDNNRNGVVDGAVDVRLSASGAALAGGAPTTFALTSPVSLAAGGRADLLVAVDTVPVSVANGTSLRLSLSGGSDIGTGGAAAVSLDRLPPEAGKHPGSYVGQPPVAVAVDGIPLDWADIAGASDPTGDTPAATVDLTGAKGNATASAVTFLVSFRGAPLSGALVPAKLPPTQQIPGTGGGGGGPAVNPPAPGSDFLFVMFDADDDPATGFASAGHGFDYAIRIDGKDGRALPDGQKLLRWEVTPTPAWTALPQAPAVAFGSDSVELGAPLPPVVLTARNVTAAAYATAWDGARDDLDGLLVFGNSLGTRGGAGPLRTVDIALGEETLWPPSAQIPEFQEVLVPVAGAAAVVFALRRRGPRPAKGRAQ